MESNDQRYYSKSSSTNVVPVNGSAYGTAGMFISGIINAYSNTNGYGPTLSYPVVMRTTPTITYYSTALGTTTAGSWSIYTNTWNTTTSTVTNAQSDQSFGPGVVGTFTAGAGLFFGAWTASAEL